MQTEMSVCVCVCVCVCERERESEGEREKETDRDRQTVIQRERERERERELFACLLVAYRPSNMRVYLRGRICTDNFTCCHTEIEAADEIFHLTQSQYTDTGPTSPCADPITSGAWQGSHWSANF